MTRIRGPIGAGKARHEAQEVMLRSLSDVPVFRLPWVNEVALLPTAPAMSELLERIESRPRRWHAVRSAIEELARNTYDAADVTLRNARKRWRTP
jgi:hypothetical protein